MRWWVVAGLLFGAPGVGLAAGFGGGINLSWTECGNAGFQNRTFACNSNAGTHALVASFQPIEAMDIVQADIIIEVRTADATTISPWWRIFNPGSCRPDVPTTSLAFGSECVDPWEGVGVSSTVSYDVGNRPRLHLLATRPNSFRVDPEYEYYAIKVDISNARTVGTPNCAGCATPACLGLISVVLRDEAGNVQDVYMPKDRHFVAWQGGQLPTGCPPKHETPAQSQTWGQIKSLYR